MAITNASLAAKKRILTACVRLFLEKGYNHTTVVEIIRDADVSASTFQNIFRAKDGVLVELVRFMFDRQFGAARNLTGAELSPVYVYAVETSIQLTLTELNENLRDIYLEAYTQAEASEYIYQSTSTELYRIFGTYLPEYSESELESRIIDHLQQFLLELGTGFAFVGRQVRFTFDEEHFMVDLVFYNRLLRCFVLFDLKIGELKHQDIGQMQMYVHYYDRKMKLPEENPTIGIILCKDKNNAVVEMTLPEDNSQIFASKYETVLPSKEDLQKLLEEQQN